MLLETQDLPELDRVKALHKELKKAEEEWVEEFRECNGVAGIYKVRGVASQLRGCRGVTNMLEGFHVWIFQPRLPFFAFKIGLDG